jgi:hypothetical protein
MERVQSLGFIRRGPCGSVGVGKNELLGRRGELFRESNFLSGRSRFFRRKRSPERRCRSWLDELDIFEGS